MTDSRGALFDQAVDDYDAVRPGYPEPLFDTLLQAVPGAGPRVLEIGAGTGQATFSFLARGCSVVAVEPGARLAARLRSKGAAHPSLTVIEGAFEAVELPPASFDVVTAATAIHWIDPAVRYRKPYALLRDGGALAIIELIQVRDPARPSFFEEAEAIYPRYRERETSAPAWCAPEADAVEPGELAAIEASGLFDAITVHRYRWDQQYTSARYAMLLRTYSDMLAMEATSREGLTRDLCRLIDDRFGGQVVRPLVVTLTLARKRP